MRPSTNHDRPSRRPHLALRAAGAAMCLAALAVAPPADAQQFTFHAEPAAAIWLDDPQSDHFTPGFYGALRPGVAIGRIVSFQWSYSTLLVPSGPNYTKPGGAHTLAAGLRLRPLATLAPPERQLGGLWVDLNVGHAWTGDLGRLGLDTGIGYGFQVAPSFALGPSIRYGHIFQPDNLPGFDPHDAQFLALGLNLSFGAVPRAPETCPECPPQETVYLEREPEPVADAEGCADRDADGICDEDDRCADEWGPKATLGCPADPCTGTPLVALVQFEYDSAALPSARDEDPNVLESVARAMAQDASCRVCVIGHASEEGSVTYNLGLSKERAASVRGFLIDHGLDGKRVMTSGMGKACQIMPEATRVLNRRVEFLRLEEGQSCPTECL